MTAASLQSQYPAFAAHRHAITKDRPRLLGSRQDLQALVQKRPDAYRRMLDYARKPHEETGYELQAKLFGLAIAYVLEGNRAEGRSLVDLVLQQFVDKPIKSGHVTFGHDMAKSAIVYDLCHDLWTPEERARFSRYVHATIAANHESEPSVFHNGWYAYKHWGYGMAGYALMHDDPLAPAILADLEAVYLGDAVPALKLAGDGGGWGEGYYIHYWLYEWMFFCEVARQLEGLDYYAAAPEFYGQRAIAAMFEAYPPIVEPAAAEPIPKAPTLKPNDLSRRLIPMGDSMGRYVRHERDKTLIARRLLAAYYRNDAAHHAVHAFNLQTPRVAIPSDAYMDFLWNDTTLQPSPLKDFKLSHHSPGPGFVYARSSWNDDATFFFFKSGPRFTAHQHLDNGQFLIFKNSELLGEGGHYTNWTGPHVVSYYLRTIAHNSLLIHDPAETWPAVRGVAAANDGGQFFPFAPNRETHVNGGALNVPTWQKNRDILDTGHIVAFDERGDFLYTAGDFTASYAPAKARCVTRQIVFLRPGTFIIFDRLESTNPQFRKSFVLQPMSLPEKRGPHWLITNGNGRLFIQTLRPADAQVTLYHGPTLYTYNDQNFAPETENNAASVCRMEISPKTPAAADCFLHVLTATDADANSVPLASCTPQGREILVTVGPRAFRFSQDRLEFRAMA